MKNRKQCIPFRLLQFFDHDLIKLFYWTTKVLVPTLGGERKKNLTFILNEQMQYYYSR